MKLNPVSTFPGEGQVVLFKLSYTFQFQRERDIKRQVGKFHLPSLHKTNYLFAVKFTFATLPTNVSAGWLIKVKLYFTASTV